MAQSLLQSNNGSPLGLGQPHKRLSEAILRRPTEAGYGQPAFPVPSQQMPKTPTGLPQGPAPTGVEAIRGVPFGLYQAPQPVADVFPANSAYDRLQQAILQGEPGTPPPPPEPEPDPAMSDPAYADMMQFLQQQMGGL